MTISTTKWPGTFESFFFLPLLTFFRVNAMFTDLMDEVHIGLNRAKFARLQNAMGQIPVLRIELLLLGVVA
jgi:hypothetical protein